MDRDTQKQIQTGQVWDPILMGGILSESANARHHLLATSVQWRPNTIMHHDTISQEQSERKKQSHTSINRFCRQLDALPCFHVQQTQIVCQQICTHLQTLTTQRHDNIDSPNDLLLPAHRHRVCRQTGQVPGPGSVPGLSAHICPVSHCCRTEPAVPQAGHRDGGRHCVTMGHMAEGGLCTCPCGATGHPLYHVQGQRPPLPPSPAHLEPDHAQLCMCMCGCMHA